MFNFSIQFVLLCFRNEASRPLNLTSKTDENEMSGSQSSVAYSAENGMATSSA